MPGLEEMMAGLFGSNEAAGLDDPRRRQRAGARGGGGYEGIGGALVQPGQFAAFAGGVPQYDYSGAMGSQFQGRGGLMQLLAQTGKDFSGPAVGHFARQGFDFMPPGLDNREAPGGPNIAPGNIDNAQALFQPQGPDHVPGVPQGVAVGQTPGRVTPTPRTQGWRNVGAGYSAAAAYGTDPYGNPTGAGLGGGRGAPAAAGQPPGATGGPSGGRPSGGGGGGGGAPQSQNAIGGGGQAVAPAGPRGGGGGGTAGAGGQANQGGGGGAPGGPTQAQINAAKSGGGAPSQGPTGPNNVPAGYYQDAGGRPGGPNQGQIGANKSGSGTRPGKLAGLSPKEKAARKAAWLAAQGATGPNNVPAGYNQDAGGAAGGPTQGQIGANKSGSGTAGKTKPKDKPTPTWQTGGGY